MDRRPNQLYTYAEVLAAYNEDRLHRKMEMVTTLAGAQLSCWSLQGCNLAGGDFRGADLVCANLQGTSFYGANLAGADLRQTSLGRANLVSADITDTKFGPRSIVPETGEFRGFKKVSCGCVLELSIPADARRMSSLVGRKCRAEFAVPVAVVHNPANRYVGESSFFSSEYLPRFYYKIGEVAKPDSYDDDIRIECTHGIHFFMSKQEAIDY